MARSIVRSILSRSDTRQQPAIVILSFTRRQGRRRGGLDMFVVPVGLSLWGYAGWVGFEPAGGEAP
jgi:hypothetical protein